MWKVLFVVTSTDNSHPTAAPIISTELLMVFQLISLVFKACKFALINLTAAGFKEKGSDKLIVRYLPSAKL